MKPFPGMFSQLNFNKHQPLSNSNSKASIGSFGKINTTKTSLRAGGLMKKKETNKSKNPYELRERLSKSIEEISQIETTMDSIPLFIDRKTFPIKQNSKSNEILIQNCEQNNEPYNQSYNRLSKVYNNFQTASNKSAIEKELADILALIRQERLAVKKKIQELQMQKQLKSKTITIQTAQNTQHMLTGTEQKQSKEQQMQTEIIEKEQIGSNQTYSKLIKILSDMNINWKQILPQEVKVEDISQPKPDKKYQQLKQSEIITVQKFVIKKLAQKITSLQHPDTN